MPEITFAPQRLLTVAEVADILRRTTDSTYILVRRGELRAVRTGRRVLVRPADLAEYIESNITQP
jgi:excisionase family DNA binding protein